MCTLLSLIIIMMMLLLTIYMGVKFSESLLLFIVYSSMNHCGNVSLSAGNNDKRKLNFVHNKMNVNVQF